MPSESTWPPPPTALNPLAEHDDCLTALICAPKTKAPMSRLRLVRELRLATGKDLRQCLAVVSDYCDRYGIFPLRRGWRLWLPFLPSLVQFGLLGMLLVSQIVDQRNIDAAPTQSARHLLRWEHVQWDFILLGLILASALVSLFMVAWGVNGPSVMLRKPGRRCRDDKMLPGRLSAISEACKRWQEGLDTKPIKCEACFQGHYLIERALFDRLLNGSDYLARHPK